MHPCNSNSQNTFYCFLIRVYSFMNQLLIFVIKTGYFIWTGFLSNRSIYAWFVLVCVYWPLLALLFISSLIPCPFMAWGGHMRWRLRPSAQLVLLSLFFFPFPFPFFLLPLVLSCWKDKSLALSQSWIVSSSYGHSIPLFTYLAFTLW